MKIHLLLPMIFLAFSNLTYGQRLKPDAVVRASHSSYNTKTIGIGRAANIFVYNNKNIYYNKIPKNRNPDIVIQRADKEGMLRAFTQVFNDGRLKELMPERYIHMTFYVDPSGRIMDMSFLLDKNTLITANELEALESSIKSNVFFKWRPEDIKGHDFFDITYAVSYSKALDRTLK
jgi:hypothetical protein